LKKTQLDCFKQILSFARRGIAALLIGLFALSSSQPALAQGKAIQLNFQNAEIDEVIGAFGIWLNRTFILDGRVRGKISLQTPRPVSPSKAYELLQATLRPLGFSTIETGGMIRVVPEADARIQGAPVNIGNLPSKKGDNLVTQIFRLNYESASGLVAVLQPFVSPTAKVQAVASTNSIMVTDYADNVQRVARVIATLDSPTTSEVEVVSVKHVVASDLAAMVNRLLDDTQRGIQVDPGQRALVIAEPRQNLIMIRAASPAKINLAKSLIARMDQPLDNAGNVHVVYLRNAEATKLAEVLRSTLTGNDSTSAASVVARANPAPITQQQGGANAPIAAPGSSTNPTVVSAGGATIAAEPSTNSLIITAPEPVYRNLRSVIDKLDVRRAQVYIESLIVEITAEDAAEFGFQWQSLLKGSGSTSTIGGTNYGSAGGANIGTVTAGGLGALTGLGGGFNLGVVSNRAPISLPGGVTVPLNLIALVKALESRSNVNILSTPNLLTIDNEEAKIVIGQNVPFITGQFSNTGGNAGAVSPFQTIERKDVGITLKVKPQVSESGNIKMTIFQESSSLGSTSRPEGVITNKREYSGTVYAEDGQMIVLGGLIEDRGSADDERVPGLGSIPIIGNLFRYDKRKRQKVNLLVFLRPIVIRSPDGADQVTIDRYDYMRTLQGNLPLPKHWLLPDVNVPQLPAQPQVRDKERPAGESGSIAPGVRDVVGAPIRRSVEQSLDVPIATNPGAQTIRVAPNEVMIVPPTPRTTPEPQRPQGSGSNPSHPQGPSEPTKIN
jgi:general secretion pathway protein D